MKETTAAVRGDSVAEKTFRKKRDYIEKEGGKTLENLLDSFCPSPLPPLKTQETNVPISTPSSSSTTTTFFPSSPEASLQKVSSAYHKHRRREEQS